MAQPTVKRKPCLDMQLCYSGFKVEELEFIGMSRCPDDEGDDFLDKFEGKLDNGSYTDEDEEDDRLTSAFESTRADDRYNSCSYLCSTPTFGRMYGRNFPQDEELSELNSSSSQFNDNIEYLRPYRTNHANDSGVRTNSISTANSLTSFFSDENGSGAGSLENLTANYFAMKENGHSNDYRKRIPLSTEMYSNVDDLELSIEEEADGIAGTLGTLKRRLSLKMLKRNISGGLFGTYLQPKAPEMPAPPTNHPSMSSLAKDEAPLLNKPTGPVNLWFRKFRNRHFI